MSFLNRLHNSKNPYQGKAKKVLCVCSAGLLRSPTAAFVLQKEYGFNTRAAGISEEYALIPVSDILVYWADLIVFMDEYQKAVCVQAFPEYMKDKETIVLDIDDKYARMDVELQNQILSKFKEKYKSTEEVCDSNGTDCFSYPSGGCF